MTKKSLDDSTQIKLVDVVDNREVDDKVFLIDVESIFKTSKIENPEFVFEVSLINDHWKVIGRRDMTFCALKNKPVKND
jgi:hypothetical protein